ncbi:hypothetical protein BDZ97DRAFT_1835379 [Flammula alnicola]|nr:hypothetical protein BDZ97DRAFT_1835379 [Flammula alnicola]
MRRSRLYSDVHIALTGNFRGSHESTSAVFSSHRFILVSRSAYFADVLSAWPTASAFQILLKPKLVYETPDADAPPSSTVHPASLHFDVGFLCTGTSSFRTGRTFHGILYPQTRAVPLRPVLALRGPGEARAGDNARALPRVPPFCGVRAPHAWAVGRRQVSVPAVRPASSGTRARGGRAEFLAWLRRSSLSFRTCSRTRTPHFILTRHPTNLTRGIGAVVLLPCRTVLIHRQRAAGIKGPNRIWKGPIL